MRGRPQSRLPKLATQVLRILEHRKDISWIGLQCRMEVHPPVVARILRYLEDCDAVTIERGRGRRRNHYEVRR
jgi:transcription initiation factor IIE alpha subunit